MSSNCKICGNARSGFVMNNKVVCLRCDELLFDLEIELEEVEVKVSDTASKSTPATKSGRTIQIVKK